MIKRFSRLPRLPKLIFLMALTVPTTVAVAEEIRGSVVDAAGKPVRGAIVRVAMGHRIVSRFSGSDGSVVISGLQPGSHQITVRAFGYGHEPRLVDPSKQSTVKIVLTPDWDVTKLTPAEYITGLPANDETRYLRVQCMGCHSWYPVYQTRGLKAEGWMQLFASMGTTANMSLTATPERRKRYTAYLLEKYFGPDAPRPQRDQVKHVPLADEALKATVYEWDLPKYTKFTHSIIADNKSGAWFTGYDNDSNYMAHINYASGEFKMYPIAVPDSTPHTPIVDKQGRVWTPLADGNALNMIDPATDENKDFMLPLAQWGFPTDGRPFRLHTPALDRQGNTLWLSSTRSNYLVSFSLVTHEWSEKPPLIYIPDAVPPNSVRNWMNIPADFKAPGGDAIPPRTSGPGNNISGGSYHVEVDSKGKVWYTQLNLGILASYDPKTGQTQHFEDPRVPSIRGMAIDADDNIWYSNWDGNGLMKLDQKKGNKITQYKMPTQYAGPYGIVIDKKGNIWIGDYAGDNITRFNPKTEKFVEYPIPTNGAMTRFISVDNEGRVWFGEWWQSRIGVLLPEGGPAPAPDLRPITVGNWPTREQRTNERRGRPGGAEDSAAVRPDRGHSVHVALVQPRQ